MDALAFTDGSSRGNPGPGGWGAIVLRNGRVTELCGAERRTTNNRMELQAAIEALARTEHPDSATIVTDSSYVANRASTRLDGWAANDWKTKTKQEGKNVDLWERILVLSEGRVVRWRVVAGHAGHSANERCDQLATAAADGIPATLFSGPAERYPFPLRSPKIETPGPRRLGAVGSGASSRSTGKAYSYLSLVDGVAQRHQSWAECHDRVKGVANARFRKARSADEEDSILAGWGVRVS